MIKSGPRFCERSYSASGRLPKDVKKRNAPKTSGSQRGTADSAGGPNLKEAFAEALAGQSFASQAGVCRAPVFGWCLMKGHETKCA